VLSFSASLVANDVPTDVDGVPCIVAVKDAGAKRCHFALRLCASMRRAKPKTA
jgi:hypothetical protein